MTKTKSSMLILIFLVLVITGCSGAKFVIQPEPDKITPPTTRGCGKIAVSEINSDVSNKIIPSSLVIEFAKHLENTGLFDAVYCPIRDNDRFDISLEAKRQGYLQGNYILPNRVGVGEACICEEKLRPDGTVNSAARLVIDLEHRKLSW